MNMGPHPHHAPHTNAPVQMPRASVPAPKVPKPPESIQRIMDHIKQQATEAADALKIRPNWNPGPIWKGQPCYVIGGGPSLRGFDWNLIKGKHTVGCNSACSLGGEYCEYCVFGDYLWWEKIGNKLIHNYTGTMVACTGRNTVLRRTAPQALKIIDRHGPQGWGTSLLGFNRNTGSVAINLALILGASPIYLLGFDMQMKDKPNWHDLRYETSNAGVYRDFIHQIVFAAQDLPKKFPDQQIINVTDGSMLKCFPVQSLKEHFGTPNGGTR